MPSWDQREIKKEARIETLLNFVVGASFSVAVIASLMLLSG